MGKEKIQANLPRMSKRNGRKSLGDTREWIRIQRDIGSQAGVESNQKERESKRSRECEVDTGNSIANEEAAISPRRNGQHVTGWLVVVELEGVGKKEQKTNHCVKWIEK